MNVDECVAVLVALGCDTDSVRVLNNGANFSPGEEVTVAELDEFQFLLSPYTAKESAFEIPASRVRIEFYTNRQVVGTLQDMMLERLRDCGLSRVIEKPKLSTAPSYNGRLRVLKKC